MHKQTFTKTNDKWQSTLETVENIASYLTNWCINYDQYLYSHISFLVITQCDVNLS